MIVKAVKVSDAEERRMTLGHYIVSAKDSPGERVEWTSVHNCEDITDPMTAVDWIANHNSINRNSLNRSIHLIASLANDESLTPDQWDIAENALVMCLGMETHPRLSAVHKDTDNEHMHIWLSRIEPTTHRAIHVHWDHYRLEKEAADLEVAFGLRRVSHTTCYEQTKQKRAEQSAERSAKRLQALQLPSVAELAAMANARRVGQDRYLALCPFHDDHHPSLRIYKGYRGEGRYHCDSCTADGSGVDWKIHVEGKTQKEALTNQGDVRLSASDVQQMRRRQDERKSREAMLGEYRDRNPDDVIPDWFLRGHPELMSGAEAIKEAVPRVERLRLAKLDRFEEPDGSDRPLRVEDVMREIDPRYATLVERSNRLLNIQMRTKTGMEKRESEMLTARQNQVVRSRELNPASRVLNAQWMRDYTWRNMRYIASFWNDGELEGYRRDEAASAKGYRTLGTRLRRAQHLYDTVNRDIAQKLSETDPTTKFGLREKAEHALSERRVQAKAARLSLAREEASPEWLLARSLET